MYQRPAMLIVLSTVNLERALGTRQYFMLKASLQTDTKWSS